MGDCIFLVQGALAFDCIKKKLYSHIPINLIYIYIYIMNFLNKVDEKRYIQKIIR